MFIHSDFIWLESNDFLRRKCAIQENNPFDTGILKFSNS